MWTATVLTLFPEMFPGPLGLSLAGRALTSGLWLLATRDIRDHANDRHRSVDDTPAGGGPGMVLRANVLARAIDAADPQRVHPRLLMSPRGSPLTQEFVRALAAGPGPLIVCGRFEGIDERVIEARGLKEVSIGDYVLSGGEIAAMALIDACVRLLPGVMGAALSKAEESFSEGLLEYPNTPGHRISRAGRSRKSSCRATMAGSPPGAKARPKTSPRPAVPTSGAPISPPPGPKSRRKGDKCPGVAYRGAQFAGRQRAFSAGLGGPGFDGDSRQPAPSRRSQFKALQEQRHQCKWRS